MDTAQEGPRPGPTQARSEHRLERAEAQRAKGDAMKPIRRQRPVEAEGDMIASGRSERDHEGDRLISETADGELERGSRGSVEPLAVVHHHEHRSHARALAEECQEGRGHGTSVERRFRLLPQQRNGQGAPLGRGKPPSGVVIFVFQQVTKARERQPGFVVAGSAAEHADRTVPRRIDRGVQQGAFPDTGGPVDDDSPRPRLNIRDESLQRFEFGLPSDDPLGAVSREMVPPCSQKRNRPAETRASGDHDQPRTSPSTPDETGSG